MTDLGISQGMQLGIERAGREGRPVELRTLPAHLRSRVPGLEAVRPEAEHVCRYCEMEAVSNG